jgi:hypothetical protein
VFDLAKKLPSQDISAKFRLPALKAGESGWKQRKKGVVENEKRCRRLIARLAEKQVAVALLVK